MHFGLTSWIVIWRNAVDFVVVVGWLHLWFHRVNYGLFYIYQLPIIFYSCLAIAS